MFTFLFAQLVHCTVQGFWSWLRSLIVTEHWNVHCFIHKPATRPCCESVVSSSHPYPTYYYYHHHPYHHPYHHHPMCV